MDYEFNQNENVTIEDCLENRKYKDKSAVIAAGKVIGWIKEKAH